MIVNMCVIGVVMGGLFGGFVIGFVVGFIGGLYCYILGGFIDFVCVIFIIVEGLIGGLLYIYLLCKGKGKLLFSLSIVFVVILFVEIV